MSGFEEDGYIPERLRGTVLRYQRQTVVRPADFRGHVVGFDPNDRDTKGERMKTDRKGAMQRPPKPKR